jgi:actin-like ATPase involved in cell morphogenesis
MKKQKITFLQRKAKRGEQQSKKKKINIRKQKKLLINMNRLEKLIENLRNTFKVAVTPYKAMLMKAGIEMVVYDEIDDETQTAIVGIKIIVNNPEVWQKLKEET